MRSQSHGPSSLPPWPYHLQIVVTWIRLQPDSGLGRAGFQTCSCPPGPAARPQRPAPSTTRVSLYVNQLVPFRTLSEEGQRVSLRQGGSRRPPLPLGGVGPTAAVGTLVACSRPGPAGWCAAGLVLVCTAQRASAPTRISGVSVLAWGSLPSLLLVGELRWWGPRWLPGGESRKGFGGRQAEAGSQGQLRLGCPSLGRLTVLLGTGIRQVAATGGHCPGSPPMSRMGGVQDSDAQPHGCW